MPEVNYRVLVVVPTTDLPLATSEALAVVSILHGESLQGHVTSDDLLSKIADGDWDIIWFCTHGNENGIMLSDGPMGSSILTSIMRTSGAKLIVLNTCSSLRVALSINNELLTDMVCTIRSVPDQDAYITAKQFAIQLARGLEPHDAYLLAKPGQNDGYVFLPGERDETMAPRSRRRDDNEVTLENVWDELTRLLEVIDGTKRYGPGLLEQVRNLRDEMESTIKDMDQRIQKAELALNRVTFTEILLSALCAFLIIIVLAVLLLR